MSLERKDVRCKLSAEAHTALAAVADYHDKDLGEYASFLLERAVLGEAHAAKVMAERAARWGKVGNPGGTAGENQGKPQIRRGEVGRLPITIDTADFFHKGASIGWSDGLLWPPDPVSPAEFVRHGRCFPTIGFELGCPFGLPELELEIAFVRESEVLDPQREETIDVLVFAKGFPDVVHLGAVVHSARRRQKQNPGHRNRARGKVEKRSIGRTPGRMKLGLDVGARALPDGPADHPCAAMLRDVRLDDREALVIRRALDRAHGNIGQQGFARANNRSGECHDIRFDELRWSHGLEPTTT